uniref:Serine/threonine-protein kinase HT1 n=1 Tax=Talaromyces marneffei PM1 TaxID=1077442 RepID=A0A093XY66_TALMA
MAESLFIDLSGNPIPDDDIIGYGGSGVVVRRDGWAIKIPRRHPWSCEADLQSNIKVLQHEQEVYRRLNLKSDDYGDCIVPCARLCTNAIQLTVMENGDLRSYLDKNRPPHSMQIAWFRQMARALEQIHSKSVILADIASRNFLLDSDFSIKVCDFSEASILPLGTIMETADDDGYSIQTDIGLLGSVFYEVITGQPCDFDLFEGNDDRATLPHRLSLPSTDTLWMSQIIEKCWVGGFQNAYALSQALEIFDLEQKKPHINGKYSIPLPNFRGTLESSYIVLAITLGALAAVTIWARRKT